MKIYVQTEIQTDDTATTEQRARQLLLETAAPPEQVFAALSQIQAGLAQITAIPPAAHETNLRTILTCDLAERGIVPAAVPDNSNGEATLLVIRTPGEPGAAEVFYLSYRVLGAM